MRKDKRQCDIVRNERVGPRWVTTFIPTSPLITFGVRLSAATDYKPRLCLGSEDKILSLSLNCHCGIMKNRHDSVQIFHCNQFICGFGLAVCCLDDFFFHLHILQHKNVCFFPPWFDFRCVCRVSLTSQSSLQRLH